MAPTVRVERFGCFVFSLFLSGFYSALYLTFTTLLILLFILSLYVIIQQTSLYKIKFLLCFHNCYLHAVIFNLAKTLNRFFLIGHAMH